jgi:hypothetical protein
MEGYGTVFLPYLAIGSFNVLDVLFGGLQAFPVAWTVFMGALGINKLKFLKTKNMYFLVCKIFCVNKYLDPDLHLPKMLDADRDPHFQTHALKSDFAWNIHCWTGG